MYKKFLKKIMAAKECEEILQLKLELDRAHSKGIINRHDHDILDQVANKFYDLLWAEND